MTLPAFLAAGNGLTVRHLTAGGEVRWWFSPGLQWALDPMLRCALGRRWWMQGVRARLYPSSASAQWPMPLQSWITSLGQQCPDGLVAQLGSPGRYRKYVAVGFEGSRAIWALKASASDGSCQSILAEAAALQALRRSMPSGVMVPRLYGCDRIEGLVVSLQEACQQPMAFGPQWTISHSDFCAALSSNHSSGTWQDALDRRERVRSVLLAAGGEARSFAEVAGRLLAYALDHLRGDIRIGWVHRDFTPWNALPTGGGLAVVDWEWADNGWVPLHDAIHFHLFPDLVRRTVDPHVWRRLAGDGSPLQTLARTLSLTSPLAAYAALWCYDTLLFYAQADHESGKPLHSDTVLTRVRDLSLGWLDEWAAAGMAA